MYYEWTLGPSIYDKKSLKRYVKFIEDVSLEKKSFAILSVIKHQTRILMLKLPLDDLFVNKNAFSEQLTKNIDRELPFALKVYNADISVIHVISASEEDRYLDSQNICP